MICPNCEHNKWDKINCAGIIIHKCKKCEGVWFDRGEFNQVITKGDFYANEIDEPSQIIDMPESAKKCPRCKVSMRRVSKHGVRIDVCRDCSGIWTDKGEFNHLSHTMTDEELS